jgi:large subunit ribosomal protein L31
MKKEIHPTTYIAKATCNSCNTEFTVSSTLDSFKVEVCSQCHPFYTGEQRIMDTAGRADRFMKRIEKSAALVPTTKKKAKKEDVVVEEKALDETVVTEQA